MALAQETVDLIKDFGGQQDEWTGRWHMTPATVEALMDAARAEGEAKAQARVAELEAGLREIADGRVGPQSAGHYNAHRKCVKIARALLSIPTGEAK